MGRPSVNFSTSVTPNSKRGLFSKFAKKLNTNSTGDSIVTLCVMTGRVRSFQKSVTPRRLVLNLYRSVSGEQTWEREVATLGRPTNST